MHIREGLENLIAKNILKITLNKINDKPVGPHPIGSYEVWVPREEFTSVLSWITINRHKDTPVLVHPLTRYEIMDHTDRAMWIGLKQRLNLAVLSADLGTTPLQNPHLKLGYSKE
jgi:DOPA 4,5-dioxygenase